MKAYIILEDGHIFEGESFGAQRESVGELVFTTGMGGYIETLTDLSYSGQIIMQTFPEIGNYGMISADFESDRCAANGYVVGEKCDFPSNFRAETTLGEFLCAQGIPGVYGIDTRGLTRIIRENGVMNAKIAFSPDGADMREIKAYKIKNSVCEVSRKTEENFPAFGEKKRKIALLDYGMKNNIINELRKRGCEVTVFPHNTRAERILSLGADALMLSNGPGDPEDNLECIKELSALLGKIPVFGICLGHQLLALAAGGKTEKLKYGHRGINQPVKNLKTGRVYITSQNHGYTVMRDGLSEIGGEISHINANDGTVEGIEYPALGAFSVQFHPEACSGPRASVYLLDAFIDRIGDLRKCL